MMHYQQPPPMMHYQPAPSLHYQTETTPRYQPPPVTHYQPPSGLHYSYGGGEGNVFGSTGSGVLMHPNVPVHTFHTFPTQPPVATVQQGHFQYAPGVTLGNDGDRHHHHHHYDGDWYGGYTYVPYSSSYYYGPYGGYSLYGDSSLGVDETPYAMNYDGITAPETYPDVTDQTAPPPARPDAYQVTGVVVSIDDQQMTVQAANGGYTFALTQSTMAQQVINVGDRVIVTFSVADDGSYQAAEITRADTR